MRLSRKLCVRVLERERMGNDGSKARKDFVGGGATSLIRELTSVKHSQI